MKENQNFEHPCLCNLCLNARDKEINKVKENLKKKWIEKIRKIVIKMNYLKW